MEYGQAKFWVEIIAASAIPIAVGFIVYERIVAKKGIGVRSIQFLGVVTIVPSIVILTFEGFLEKSASGALIGALLGYLLSSIAKFDEKRATKDPNTMKPKSN